jgi:hypothetical protein
VKGKECAPFTITVERGKIKEFAPAEWGDIIAPPTFPVTFRDENADTGSMLRD